MSKEPFRSVHQCVPPLKGDCVYTGVERGKSLGLDRQFILLDMGWISMFISLFRHLGWSFKGEAVGVYLELR